MSVTYDEGWIPSLDGQTHTRQVYRVGESIGRVRRWQQDAGDLAWDWFTTERRKGAFYVPIAGEHATFEEALEHIVMFSVAQ